MGPNKETGLLNSRAQIPSSIGTRTWLARLEEHRLTLGGRRLIKSSPALDGAEVSSPEYLTLETSCVLFFFLAWLARFRDDQPFSVPELARASNRAISSLN